ncbi:MAG: hypothetical protein N3F09_08190 [Bacteroidia bacterium]|nr:hypothetical protein [Bacteroidia bacterium]
MKAIKILLICILFTSCKKEKSEMEIDNEYQSAIDNAIAEQEFMAIVPTTNNHTIKTKNANGSFKIMTTCDTLVKISGDSNWFTNPANSSGPPTFTLDMNKPGCEPMPEGNGGRVRQGYLWIRLWKRLQDPSTSGHNATIKLINYKASFDPNKPISYMCDSITIQTISNNSNTGERLFRVRIYNGKCQTPTWNTDFYADRYVKVETFADNDRSNDIIRIWGNSGGKNRNGREYTVTISENTPITKHANCPYISFGIINLTPNGLKTRTVDYANGTNQDICDDKATITINGVTTTINLK